MLAVTRSITKKNVGMLGHDILISEGGANDENGEMCEILSVCLYLAAPVAPVCMPAGAAAQQPLTIYLLPRGDDARTGLTQSPANHTLNRAHAIVESTLAEFPRDVDIIVATGTFGGG